LLERGGRALLVRGVFFPLVIGEIALVILLTGSSAFFIAGLA